jgi:uncharacterized membrane protein YqgA involved in biofilm formation
MIGTILNAAGILVGGILGLTLTRQFSPAAQQGIKGLLGVLVVVVGLKATWTSLGPGFGLAAKQMTIVLLAMILGRLTGRLLHLQNGLNRLGQYAKQKFTQAGSEKPQRWSEGFITCTILFCVGPMAILGSIQDGLDGRWQTLGIKAVMDGLATMAFVSTFGWGAIFSVVPVVAYQGTLTLAAKLIAPFVQNHAMLDSINAVGGLLVFCIALIILDLKKVELADYLPSLIYAPLLTWWWK